MGEINNVAAPAAKLGGSALVKDCLTARTEGGRLVRLTGDKSLIGTFQIVTITGSTTWSLTGNLSEKE